MLEILKSEPEFEDKYEVYDWSSETKTDVKTYWRALGQCGGPLTDKLNLKDDEAIVYCVSQFSPSNSGYFRVKMNAYSNFKIELIDVNGFYFVKWFINNILVKELQTEVKSNIEFRAHCSLENLHFMGDKPTSKENYVLFDAFQFEKN